MRRLSKVTNRKQKFDVKTAADAAGSNTDDIPDETVVKAVTSSSTDITTLKNQMISKHCIVQASGRGKRIWMVREIWMGVIWK